MAGIEDKTKRKEPGPTSKETSGLLGEEAAQKASTVRHSSQGTQLHSLLKRNTG